MPKTQKNTGTSTGRHLNNAASPTGEFRRDKFPLKARPKAQTSSNVTCSCPRADCLSVKTKAVKTVAKPNAGRPESFEVTFACLTCSHRWTEKYIATAMVS